MSKFVRTYPLDQQARRVNLESLAAYEKARNLDDSWRVDGVLNPLEGIAYPLADKLTEGQADYVMARLDYAVLSGFNGVMDLNQVVDQANEIIEREQEKSMARARQAEQAALDAQAERRGREEGRGPR